MGHTKGQCRLAHSLLACGSSEHRIS